MMRLILMLLSAGVAMATTSLDHVRHAQAMLGERAWSRVIRVVNTAAHSRYPAVVYALVFEEADLLWFYTDVDGTQSLSLYRNRLTQEKADLRPLLQAIEPGFTAFTFVSDERSGTRPSADQSLPNGCFIESLAALRDRIERGEPIERPRLLSCYATTSAGVRGHTVLTYLTPEGFFMLDPARSSRPQAMPRGWVEKPLALAEVALAGVRVLKARWIPVAVPRPAMMAKLDFSPPALTAEAAAVRAAQLSKERETSARG